MSFKKLIVNRKLLIGKKLLKVFSLFTFHFSLILILSGCSAIGFTKYAALQVTSTPEASIFLDGKHLGKTPFYSDQLKSGAYMLKVTASDATYSEEVELKEKSLTVVNRDLSSNFLAQSGEVLMLRDSLKGAMISSLPSDADVAIDGHYVGKTPQLVADIADGDHKILLTKDGYIDREFSIKTSTKSQVVAQVTLASKIAKGLAKEATSESKPKQTVEIIKTPQNIVKVRKEADTASAEIGQLKTGEKAQILEEKNQWLKIIFQGKQGWIPKEFTR